MIKKLGGFEPCITADDLFVEDSPAEKPIKTESTRNKPIPIGQSLKKKFTF
jgi:hypothetical protein